MLKVLTFKVSNNLLTFKPFNLQTFNLLTFNLLTFNL